MSRSARSALLASAVAAWGCSGGEATRGSSGPERLDEDALMDPAACSPCHAGHVEEWAGSMHAYSSRDPLFLAMNRRGQEETSGALGTFCVKCHAPLAAGRGLTKDGTDLDALPEAVRGVSCYFCHSVTDVESDHDNGLVLAPPGGALHGGIEHPAAGAPHGAAYSALHDARDPGSSALCGSCHDVTLEGGVALERTFAEWRGSVFAPEHAASASAAVSCSGCHMPARERPAATTGSRSHGSHDHSFPGVDVPLVPYPADALGAAGDDGREGVQRLLDASLGVEICVQPRVGSESAVYVTLENSSAGHGFPSGASQDRRVWVEVTAYDAAGTEIYASGKAPPDEAGSGGELDADLFSLNDVALAGDGSPAHMFWETASVELHAIPAPVTLDPASKDALLHHVTRRFPRSRDDAIAGVPSRVTVRVLVRPVGLDILGDLAGTGHLDAGLAGAMPTFVVTPNRHLEGHPTLGSLSGATFEWSDAVRTSGLFSTRTLNDDAFPKLCVATTPRK